MDLIKNFPRSPYDMNVGIVMLPRTTDKAKAHNAKKLGEYHYDCPLDKALFEFLGMNAEIFSKKVNELKDDEKIAEWIKNEFSRTQKEKDKFNNDMRHSKPKDKESQKWLDGEKKKLGRNDYFTYFDNIDADEKRF